MKIVLERACGSEVRIVIPADEMVRVVEGFVDAMSKVPAKHLADVVTELLGNISKSHTFKECMERSGEAHLKSVEKIARDLEKSDADIMAMREEIFKKVSPVSPPMPPVPQPPAAKGAKKSPKKPKAKPKAKPKPKAKSPKPSGSGSG